MSPADDQPGQPGKPAANAGGHPSHLSLVPDIGDAEELDDDELEGDELDDDDLTEEEYAELADFQAVEELVDAWSEDGWLQILPTLALEILQGIDAPLTTRAQVLQIADNVRRNANREPLDGDHQWPILTEPAYRTADLDLEFEAEIDPEFDLDEYQPDPDQPSYEEYVAEVRAAREEWAGLLERQGEPAVATAEDLLGLLDRWGLVEQGPAGDDVVEFVADPPDPLHDLQLSERTASTLVADRLDDDVAAVYDELHDFLFHSQDTELTIRIGQLADRMDADSAQVRTALITILADSESGLTTHRRGPKGEQQLPAADLETLAEHARFVLRVDRDAAGFPDHVGD